MLLNGRLLTVALCAALLASASTLFAGSVQITKIGTPGWSIVDTHLVAADVGTGSDGYAAFFKLTGEQILTAPFYKNYPGVGAGPSGVPHPPPYNQDLANGLSALGLADHTVFPVTDFSSGRGVVGMFMIVADGSQTGSSPDFTSGPIIPNSQFPLAFDLADKKGGTDFSAPGSFTVPSHTTLDPAFANLNGTSHLPLFIFDNADFANDPKAPLAGDYQYQIKALDASGNGYNVVMPFTVGSATAVPLPAALGPGLALMAMLPMARRVLRRRVSSPPRL